MAHARSGGEILSNQDRIRSMPGAAARTGPSPVTVPVDQRLTAEAAAQAETAAWQEYEAEVEGRAAELRYAMDQGMSRGEARNALEVYEAEAEARFNNTMSSITNRNIVVPGQRAGNEVLDGAVEGGFPGMPGMFASSPALVRLGQAEDPGSSIVLDKGDLETQLYGQMRRRQSGTPDVALAPQELAYFAKRGALADFAREAEGDIRRDLASGAIDAGRAAERMAKLQKTSASAVDKLSVFGTEQPPQAPQVPTPQQPRAFEPPAAGVAPQAPQAIEAPVAATDQDRALGLIEGLGETVQERIGNLEIAAGSARTQEQQDLVLRVAEHMVFPPRSLVERWSGRQREAARDRLRNLFPKQGKGPSDLDIAKAADLRSKTATRGSEDTRKQNKYLRNMRRKPTGKPDWRFYQSTVTASAKSTTETIRSLRTDVSSLRARRAKALKVAEKPLPVFDVGEGDAEATKRAQKAKDAGAGLVTEIDALIFKRVAERDNKERYLTTIKADQAKWSELRGRNDWAAARRWLVERFGPEAVLKRPAANNLVGAYLREAAGRE
jgi:hypothetical protein